MGERPDPLGELYLYGGVEHRARRDAELMRQRIVGGHDPLLPGDKDYMARWSAAGGPPIRAKKAEGSES